MINLPNLGLIKQFFYENKTKPELTLQGSLSQLNSTQLNSTTKVFLFIVFLLCSGKIFAATVPGGYNSSPSSFIAYSDSSRTYFYQNLSISNNYYVQYQDVGGNVIFECTANYSTSSLDYYNMRGDIIQTITNPRVISSDRENGYPGDCDKVGGLRKNETYGDCFKRNASNYCCDGLSCATVLCCGPQVAVAIGIACLIPDGIVKVPSYFYMFSSNTTHKFYS